MDQQHIASSLLLPLLLIVFQMKTLGDENVGRLYFRESVLAVTVNTDMDKVFLMDIAKKNVILLWSNEFHAGQRVLIQAEQYNLKRLLRVFKRKDMDPKILIPDIHKFAEISIKSPYINRVVDYSIYSLVSVTPRTDGDVKFLNFLHYDKYITIWNGVVIAGQPLMIQVKREQVNHLLRDLRSRNLTSRIEHRNLQRIVSRERTNLLTASTYHYASKFNFNKYHRLDSIYAFLEHITQEYGSKSKIINIGSSYESRPILGVEISSCYSKSGRKKDMILMECGIHAREWASVAFCLYLINELIVEDISTRRALERYDFTIIPVLNPDGYEFSMEYDRLWRKTRSRHHDVRCIGVDPNRNFNVNFCKTDDNLESSNDPCAEVYCGSEPFSEPETASFEQLLRKLRGRLKAYFAIHTFGQLWMIPWAKSRKEKVHNYEEMLRVAKIGARALKRRYGTDYVVGAAAEIGYPAHGTSLDYVYDKGYANYSFNLELRDEGRYGFILPGNQLDPMFLETTDGVVAAVMALK